MEPRMERETQHTREAMGEMGQKAKEMAGDLSSKAREMSERFGEKWSTVRDNVQEKTMAGARATDRAIRDYPYASLGVAFGLGLIIGVIINAGRE